MAKTCYDLHDAGVRTKRSLFDKPIGKPTTNESSTQGKL